MWLTATSTLTTTRRLSWIFLKKRDFYIHKRIEEHLKERERKRESSVLYTYILSVLYSCNVRTAQHSIASSYNISNKHIFIESEIGASSESAHKHKTHTRWGEKFLYDSLLFFFFSFSSMIYMYMILWYVAMSIIIIKIVITAAAQLQTL